MTTWPRIAADADPDAAASLLVGACFHEAFLYYYAHGAEGPAAGPAAEAFVEALITPLS
ncbi:hypothetical protein [Nocardia carnea]|uniref:hypothetical protein n=1 Tax=Nocardia carnea TaxID=37328 RepID=UPI0024574CD7|nr:hypothetical protein [Nocardia carnea]